MQVIKQLMFKRANDNSVGSVIVEFLLIVPVILFISLTGVELARALNSYETLAALASRAMRVTYEQCYGAAQSEQPACVQGVITSLNKDNFITTQFPETEIVISVYARSGASNVSRLDAMSALSTSFRHIVSGQNCDVSLIGNPAHGACQSALGNKSAFNKARIDQIVASSSTVEGYEALPLQKPVLVVAEVYMPYRILFRVSRNIMPFNPGTLYEAAIL